jgi:CheY-like chemotaxis protein
MHLLLVEDDDRKRHLISEFVSSTFPEMEISEALSYNSALRSIRYSGPDLILLDMSLTTFDPGPEEVGGTPRPFAGRELLSQMERRHISIPTIVVTQYPRFGEGVDRLTLSELDEKLKAAYPDLYFGTVYYNESIEGWKEELALLMNRAVGR